MEGSAWELAVEAARRAGVELRPLDGLDDTQLINGVEVATWGDEQELGREIVRALQHSGNVPLGAFAAGGQLVGYVLGFAGVDASGLHVHSHMLAALPGWRSRGVGFALKLAQRAQALDQGVHVARWTFDPLIARNAYFNIVKLGAECDRFERNFYGSMNDAQNRNDRSDRFSVRWDLDREPLSRPAEVIGQRILVAAGSAARPTPELQVPTVPPSGQIPVLVQVPREYQRLREEDPGLARRWRDATAEVIEACLTSGRVASGFTSDSEYVFT